VERSRRHEQLRKDSFSAVYRRLAKELHPDLDAIRPSAEREPRMQEITGRLRPGNLHALLQLELQWLSGRASTRLALSLDKLRTYTELLSSKRRELADEVRSLQFHPRYAALIVDGTVRPADGHRRAA